ncbi:VOC family protein [Ktedonobacter robiniae]|uniref:Glyoxalase n=1 Tax=Ktedonobacter robiniae TaxID=2778365 RepID=A0ABQ3UV48_9CHLR|nr:VOC family protein [Ktedonobacter robiniae]GHO56462.1 glyoxalase [Ktedonobacter robiniae]
MTQAEIQATTERIDTLTPHIVVRDAGKAAEWYKEVLGAEERGRVPVPGGKFMQIELWFGNSAVMLADEFLDAGIFSLLAIGGTPVVLHLTTKKVEALWQRAIDAGAVILQPLQEQFWGDLHGQILDPFGYRWNLAQHLRDVPSEEIARIAASIFGGQA